MTDQDAIEVLKDLLTDKPQFPPHHRREAIRLAIEALEERIQMAESVKQ